MKLSEIEKAIKKGKSLRVIVPGKGIYSSCPVLTVTEDVGVFASEEGREIAVSILYKNRWLTEVEINELLLPDLLSDISE